MPHANGFQTYSERSHSCLVGVRVRWVLLIEYNCDIFQNMLMQLLCVFFKIDIYEYSISVIPKIFEIEKLHLLIAYEVDVSTSQQGWGREKKFQQNPVNAVFIWTLTQTSKLFSCTFLVILR